jgi:hypothetical protein
MKTSARSIMSVHRERPGRRDWTRTNDPYHVKVENKGFSVYQHLPLFTLS